MKFRSYVSFLSINVLLISDQFLFCFFVSASMVSPSLNPLMQSLIIQNSRSLSAAIASFHLKLIQDTLGSAEDKSIDLVSCCLALAREDLGQKSRSKKRLSKKGPQVPKRQCSFIWMSSLAIKICELNLIISDSSPSAWQSSPHRPRPQSQHRC